MPTAAEMVVRKLKEKQTQEAEERERELIAKYGEREQENPDYDVILGQSETYIEYLPDGKIKDTRSLKAQIGKTRYEEDLFTNGHSTVWGSWWNSELGWGYACCHQTEKGGICLGEKGKKLADMKESKVRKVKQRGLNAFISQVVDREASLSHSPEDLRLHEQVMTGRQKSPTELFDANVVRSFEDLSEPDSQLSKHSSRSGLRKGRLAEKQEIRKKAKERKYGIDDNEKLKKTTKSGESKVKQAYRGLNDKRRYKTALQHNNKSTEKEIEAHRLTKKRFEDPMHFI